MAERERRQLQPRPPGRRRLPKLVPPNDLQPLSREAMKGYNRLVYDTAAKTDGLMDVWGTTMREWCRDGAVYQRHLQRAVLVKLHTLQFKIIQTVAERTAELSILHRRVRGLHNSHRFVAALNSRWKQLESQVAAYNEELSSLDHLDLGLRPLIVSELKKNGLDAEEIWDVDRAMCNSDWAVYDYVREGIEATFVLRRCKEEAVRLKLHCERVVNWLKWRVRGMLSALEQRPESSMFIDRVWMQLIHYDRMIDSLLRMKGRGILNDRERQLLFGEKCTAAHFAVTVADLSRVAEFNHYSKPAPTARSKTNRRAAGWAYPGSP
jgi:hypothetical protein